MILFEFEIEIDFLSQKKKKRKYHPKGWHTLPLKSIKKSIKRVLPFLVMTCANRIIGLEDKKRKKKERLWQVSVSISVSKQSSSSSFNLELLFVVFKNNSLFVFLYYCWNSFSIFFFFFLFIFIITYFPNFTFVDPFVHFLTKFSTFWINLLEYNLFFKILAVQNWRAKDITIFLPNPVGIIVLFVNTNCLRIPLNITLRWIQFTIKFRGQQVIK